MKTTLKILNYKKPHQLFASFFKTPQEKVKFIKSMIKTA
ncbi:hypothetical protein N478_17850 [Pseudoalteromonas luteoviolacea S4060-1]|uniref:Uncharacterized protein n=1 Tax=Pseudoalteromonas luteoviolacea S4060-1 TaxID=1365257 RepID=A0A167N0Y1_9GAMM|nr:hypothetical protein N478_17850 [Pseudoalteromonas luteoviolacea S4060-1]